MIHLRFHIDHVGRASALPRLYKLLRHVRRDVSSATLDDGRILPDFWQLSPTCLDTFREIPPSDPIEARPRGNVLGPDN